MSRSPHLDARATRLAHRALSALVDSWGDPEQLTDAEEAIRALYLWLGQTPSGQGLTSEPDDDHAARVEMGVRVTVDGSGALVVRVPRRKL